VSSVFAGVGAIVVPFVLKLAADYLLVRPALTRFRRIDLLAYFLPFEIYYIFYVVLFPPIVLFNRTVAWKGRDLKG
jgi:hypothetical protein